MKCFMIPSLVIIIFFSALSALIAGKTTSEYEFIKKDSMNLAILKVDFKTYEFEGADVSYHEAMNKNEIDSLPFGIEIKPPADKGYIQFNYTKTGSVLFHGEIIWMGVGEIIKPEKFEMLDNTVEEEIPKPEDPEYFDIANYAGLDKKDFQEKTDSVWNEINDLKIVKEFADNNYHVGFYCYIRSTGGMFNPETADWIVFLHSEGPSETNIEDILENSKIFDIYPNPVENSIIVKTGQKPNFQTDYKVRIYNILGNKLYEGKLNSSHKIIDLSGYSKGVYILEISTPNYSKTEKIIIR